MKVLARVLSALGLITVAWCLLAWPAVVHGHPLYLVLLSATVVVSVVVALMSFRRAPAARGWRRALGIVGAVVALGWLAALVWLRPFAAVEPALTAMVSDGAVTVRESATRVVLEPAGGAGETGVFFQPGAKVEARAYAAVLRPLAEAGYTVVIAKQPLGIAFLATGAFEGARSAHPEIAQWVVGGHSLGGVVASTDAEAHDEDATGPVSGLLLYASYPATDLTDSLTGAVISISGTEDGLTTPDDVEASRADLPPTTEFVVVDGAVHAQFGDYGPQPGDGTPTIDDDDARAQISAASLAFVASIGG